MRTFQNADEAKQFFIDQIVAQSERDHAPLSGLEKTMLAFTEDSPRRDQFVAVATEFDKQYASEAYEAKIAGLVKAAYERDVAEAKARGGSDARETWRSAYATLRKGDHYILVMIDRALSRKLRKWLGLF